MRRFRTLGYPLRGGSGGWGIRPALVPGRCALQVAAPPIGSSIDAGRGSVLLN